MTKKKIQESLVAICMGSQSDWPIMKESAHILKLFCIPFEPKVISAHRTPVRLSQFAQDAHHNGFSILIAGAGGAAHLPGMLAAYTHLPVLGVPIETTSLNGMDSLLSIAQMPAGVPVGTLAIGSAGAKNAALLAVQILALSNDKILQRLNKWRQEQTDNVILAPE